MTDDELEAIRERADAGYGASPDVHRALLAEVDRLREALRAAATSLTTLSLAGTRNSASGIEDMIDVRGYANSRARVAWAALTAADETPRTTTDETCEEE